jgi:hypothetical protein
MKYMDALILFVLMLNFVVLFSFIGNYQDRTKRKLKQIEYCLNVIVDHLEIDRFPEEIKEMALDPDPQQRLKAVRLYIKKTGATLQEATEAVEKLSDKKSKS